MEIIKFVPDGCGDCQVTGWLPHKLTEVSPVKRPAIVICPGGGYAYCSEREGEPVARKYYAAGFCTFILSYSVGDRARNFEPLVQLAAAVVSIREHAEDWNIDPTKVIVCGFSAGGHLAAALGVLHNDEKFLSRYPAKGNIRPDALLLGYPVITADRFTHKDSLRNVTGDAPEGTTEYAYWGLDTHVDSETPPTFLWHNATDNVVPVENSLKMAAALSAAKVPFELHIFPSGRHGMSVCTQEISAESSYHARWVDWSIAWLHNVLNFKE